MIEWDEYRDPIGFMSGPKHPTGSSGNGILFSAEERLLRLRLGTWNDILQKALEYQVSSHCERKSGLLMRPPPFSQDQESLDDYIAYASISPNLAGAALRYGRRNYFRPKWFGGLLALSYHYSLVGDEQDVAAWLGRFPAVIAHFQWSADESPWLWRRLWWFISIVLSGSKNNQDPWILSFVMLETEGGRTWLGVLAGWIYRWRLKRAYGSLANVFSTYLKDENHPNVLACKQLGL
jgi:hypothetical protein